MKNSELPDGPAVSAIIITFNEAENLRRTLSQLYWCDEIIIVDSYSTDGTVSIAREYNCKLISRTFNGYGDQKCFAVSLCKNDWILCLDADEYLTDALISEILTEMAGPGMTGAFSFPSALIFRKKRFLYGRESNRQVVKLFNRLQAQISMDRVHEKVLFSGKVKQLNSALLHYSYRDITQYFAKFDRYTEWCAEIYFAGGKRKSKIFIVLSVPYYFLKYYLLDRNILNGINGLYWSALMSFYHFVKYLKLEDLYQPGATLSPATGKKISLPNPLHKRNPIFSGSAEAI